MTDTHPADTHTLEPEADGNAPDESAHEEGGGGSGGVHMS